MGHWPISKLQRDWGDVSDEGSFVCSVLRPPIQHIRALHNEFFYTAVNRIEESVI
jgi:hypothetical protein